MVQEGAGGDIEDGLGADGLRCMHLGRPVAPVSVLEYSSLNKPCVLDEVRVVTYG